MFNSPDLQYSIFLLFMAFGLIAATVYGAFLCYRAEGRWKTGVKAIPLMSFVIAGIAYGAAPLMILALFLSLIGDVALSRDGERAFLIGLVAFALAHLAFVLLFLSLGGGISLVPLIAVVLLAASTEIWLQPFAGSLRWPVRIYVALIAAMGITAFGLHGREIATFGAVLFLASDLLLAIQVFRLRPDGPWHKPTSILLWVFYILSQGAIFIGAGFTQALFSI